MPLFNRVRVLALTSFVLFGAVVLPAVQVHAQPAGDAGIEMDCPLGGHWVVNGGYVIAKDSQGRYHRVFCNNGQWVDGGVITAYIAAPQSSSGGALSAAGAALP